MNSILMKGTVGLFSIVSIICGIVIGVYTEIGVNLKFLGDIYLNLMFCCAVPFIFISLLSSIVNAANVKENSRIFVVTIVVFFITSVISAVFAAIVMHFTSSFWSVDGAQMGIDLIKYENVKVWDVISEVFTKPDFYLLFSKQSIFQLVIFSILLGMGIRRTCKNFSIRQLLMELQESMLEVTKIVSYCAPVGFVGLFADMSSSLGSTFAVQYINVFVVYCCIVVAYIFVFFPTYVFSFCGINCLKIFLSHYWASFMNAGATCSSSANIPVNYEIAKKSNIDDDVSSVVIPFGAVCHMDGSSIGLVVKALFVMGIFGQSCDLSGYFLIIMVSVLGSIGMAPVPGSGVGELVMCSLLFNDSPEHFAMAYTVAVGIGIIIDMPATIVNSSGDYMSTFIVQRLAK